jgi:hypothetical protein
MAKSKPLTAEQNAANLAAVNAAKRKVPAPPPSPAPQPASIRCKACNRESPAGTVTCTCGAHFEYHR